MYYIFYGKDFKDFRRRFIQFVFIYFLTKENSMEKGERFCHVKLCFPMSKPKFNS